MKLGFSHFLIGYTFITGLLVSLALFTIIQQLLETSNHFSPDLFIALAEDPWDWNQLMECVDFLSQPAVIKAIFFKFLTSNSQHILVLLLLMLNIIFVIGWIFQRAIFTQISNQELSAAQSAIVNFLIFRLIFLGTILETTPTPSNNRTIDDTGVDFLVSPSISLAPGSNPIREICVWMGWLCLIGFMRWFVVLLRERFQTAQSNPHATEHTFMKYMMVTVGFGVMNMVIGTTVFLLFYRFTSIAILSLLLYENIYLSSECVRVVYKYYLYISTLQENLPWEERGSSLYYVDTACQMFGQAVTLAHLLHIWSHYGLSFSLFDVLLAFYVRSFVVGIYRNIQAIRTYSKVIHDLNQRFPDATPEELRQLDDVCGVCRDSMERAKRLPCGHLFHRTCLQQWVEYQSFCPSCRAPLTNQPNQPLTAAANHHPPGPNIGDFYPGNIPPAVLAQHQQQLQQRGLVNAADIAALRLAATQNQSPANSSSSASQSSSSLQQGGAGATHMSPSDNDAPANATGLRHRYTGATTSSSSSSSTSSSSSSSHPHAPTPSPSHGHSHQAGMAHGHTHGPTTIQPLFRFDTSRFSWLPSFSLEVQSVREGEIIPNTIENQPTPSYSNTTTTSTTATNPSVLDADEDMPDLEPIPTESTSQLPTSSSTTSSSSSTLPTTSPTSSTSPSLSLREKIYLATQRRLEQEKGGSAAAAVDEEAKFEFPPGYEIQAKIAPEPVDEATCLTPATHLPSTSSSTAAIPSDLSSADALPSLPQPVSTGSPLLLSQAEADANLARELQYEESLLAAEEDRQRRLNGGGPLARFFGGGL